jgi:hypothetical protein
MRQLRDLTVKPFFEGARIASEYCKVNYSLMRGSMEYFRTGEEKPYYQAAIKRNEELKKEIEEMKKNHGIESFFKRIGFNRSFIRGTSSILAPICKKAGITYRIPKREALKFVGRDQILSL